MADIEHLIHVAASVATVLPLVSTGDGFKQWWAEDVVTMSDDTVELGFFGRTTVYELALEGRASSIVAWRCQSGKEWKGTRLRFALIASEGGTRVRFTHAGWAERTEYFDSCNTTWGELMYRLKAAAEGCPRGPLFDTNGVAY